MIEKRNMLNRALGWICVSGLTVLIAVFFIQFDILGSNYIRDIPNVIKYNKFKFNLSGIYSNAFFYGVNPKFIVFTVIFNVFTYIPIGVLVKKINRKPYLMLGIAMLLYEVIKSLLRINPLSVDISLLHYIGLCIGYKMGNTGNGNILDKGKMLLICFFLFSMIGSNKLIYEIFIINIPAESSQSFILEEEIDDDTVTGFHKHLFELYKSYLLRLVENDYLTGKFEGLFVHGNTISIKVDGIIHDYYFDDNSRVLDKRVLDDNHGKIFIHPYLGDILNDYIDDMAMYRLNERIAVLVNSEAEITVIADDNNMVEYICTTVEEYKSEEKRF